ncbi:MAG: antitoxin [Nitrospinae bacterium]|nr:antitoxin [Nitrospinota bacterium]
MNSKLTLRIDSQLIEAAKKYSSESGKSLSRIVSDLFTLIQNERKQKDTGEASPSVLSLKGSMQNKPVSEEDYRKSLEEKYL